MKGEPMTTNEIRVWIEDQAGLCAAQWYREQSQRPYAAFYLWHKPGGLAVAEEKPEGFELSTSERISPMQERAHLAAWIMRHAARLPILTPKMAGAA